MVPFYDLHYYISDCFIYILTLITYFGKNKILTSSNIYFRFVPRGSSNIGPSAFSAVVPTDEKLDIAPSFHRLYC